MPSRCHRHRPPPPSPSPHTHTYTRARARSKRSHQHGDRGGAQHSRILWWCVRVCGVVWYNTHIVPARVHACEHICISILLSIAPCIWVHVFGCVCVCFSTNSKLVRNGSILWSLRCERAHFVCVCVCVSIFTGGVRRTISATASHLKRDTNTG